MRSRVTRGQAQKGGTEIDLTELKSNGIDSGMAVDISVFYFTPLSKVSITWPHHFRPGLVSKIKPTIEITHWVKSLEPNPRVSHPWH